jgi:hypothetical protein
MGLREPRRAADDGLVMLIPRLLSRRLAGRLPLALLGALSILSPLLLASPASAVVREIPTPGGVRTVGLTPQSIEFGFGEPLSFANNTGHPVMHSNNVYAIYWDPDYLYHGDWQGLIDTYLQRVAGDSGTLGNHYAIDAQYTDQSNAGAAYSSAYRGAYTDTDHYPPSGCADPNSPATAKEYDFGFIACVTDQQIQEELTKFIPQSEPGAPSGLPKGMSSLFFVLTPPGVSVCIDAGGPSGHCSDNPPSGGEPSPNGICSYHSAITSNPSTGDANTIVYAVVPWTAGGLDDNHLPGKLAGTLGSVCQDGNWDASEPNLDSSREGDASIKPPNTEPVTEQQPNQLTSFGPDGTYDEGLADLVINQLAVQQQNTITDPLLNGWQDNAHGEVMDECRNYFAPILGGAETPLKNTNAGNLFNQVIGGDNYYLNDTFNLAGLQLPYPGVPCGVESPSLLPAFTAPTLANTSEALAFDGQESNITLDAGTTFSSGVPKANYPTYTWDFGDGTPALSGYAPGASSPGPPPCAAPWLTPCAASAFHTYQYGGEYRVTLTVKDVAGNTATATRTVTVTGPARPGGTAGSEGAAGSSASGAGAGAGAGGSSPGSTAQSSSTPGPVASEAVISKSLPKVLRNGLVVRYSVNEQVAGHFEVLLASAIANRLGLHGSPATGLAPGSPPEMVIAKAILVTTKGGHSSVKIKFSKRTAARLKRLRKVTLTLRLIVRDASLHHPQSTTVLSTVVLHH